ncbi:hypothetical protein PPL_05900 [Heterostelium album PN500]|uniref:Uncharacterized protein n=1 Tax=Heterostelium pallidum (strain ATCC 26659 / Pp 5 / PN500) TaxID=670386 RepID=D3BBN1_HETP5|nr:hypothetical protein PPL_05900 [Heterostelium album PN500]EFA81064.1 hypothetical protein PPL_05900 [Heterostelium album PN500]|eukprot:XP_020433182.1 hypothetical protein PPL_05900 [Heterostelium album PN500]
MDRISFMKFITLALFVLLVVGMINALQVVDKVDKPSFCPTIHKEWECMLAGQVCVWNKGKCQSNPYSTTQEEESAKPSKEYVSSLLEGFTLNQNDNSDVAEMLKNNEWACNILKTPAKCLIGTMAGHCLWWGGKCHTV